jgi:hypothetical protein
MTFDIGKNALQLGVFAGIIALLAVWKVTGNADATLVASVLGILALFLKQIQLGGNSEQ